MGKDRLPAGIRKYIRKEKARIRKRVFRKEEQEEKIKELYARFLRKDSNKKSAQEQDKEKAQVAAEPAAA